MFELETKLTLREESLDRRSLNLDKREETLNVKESKLDDKKVELEQLNNKVDELLAQQQAKLVEIAGLTKEEATAKFGFFLEAFEYGAPPHCGVGIGLERLIMILSGTDNIKDVVAFPKTASAMCLMSEAPNVVDKKQLDDLRIAVKEDK